MDSYDELKALGKYRLFGYILYEKLFIMKILLMI